MQKAGTSRRRLWRLSLARGLRARKRVLDELASPSHDRAAASRLGKNRRARRAWRAVPAREIGRIGDDHPHGLIANAGEIVGQGDQADLTSLDGIEPEWRRREADINLAASLTRPRSWRKRT
jgi:hypothetical protein